MPNDNLAGAIKRRSCRETAISRALSNGHSFHGGTEVESPLLQRKVSCEPDFPPLKSRTVGLSALCSSLRCRALNRFREIAIVTTILVEPINLP